LKLEKGKRGENSKLFFEGQGERCHMTPQLRWEDHDLKWWCGCAIMVVDIRTRLDAIVVVL